MGIYKTLPEEIQEVDIIIAGGGTTGCILASRVAEADPRLSILLIEHGPDNQGISAVTHPLLWRANLLPRKRTAIYYMGKNESQLAHRGIPVVAGGLLGGGSSVSLSMYMRPQSVDYDAWNVEGWSADDLRPFMNKIETYYGDGMKEDHGQDGPIEVSSGPYRQLEVEGDFISAMNQVGYPETTDLQDLHSNNGVSHCLKYVSPDGKRQDVAQVYLHPRLQDDKHGNLHVLLESQVTKILIDGETKQAVGVEYRTTPSIMKNNTSDTTRKVKANKLVVLSCGALGNPGILERSGVGDPKVLGKARVPVVAAVPGVGHGYQDHQLISCHYKANISKEETSDNAFIDPPHSIEKLVASNDRILGWNGVDTSSKIRPTEAEVDALGHDFRNAWDRDYKNAPERPLATITLSTGLLANPSTFPQGSYISLGFHNSYPYSRGHVHITGPNPEDPLDFTTGYLTDDHEIDLKTHVWGYKKQREVARQMKVYQGEVEGQKPKFPPGSKAAIAEPIQDGSESCIEYSAEDDVAISDWIRKNVTTCWHGLGTCKMAPRDGESMGVVDKSLNVYGVKGLKVADLSIAPGNVSSGTLNTALTIGEKAASIIIQELGLA